MKKFVFIIIMCVLCFTLLVAQNYEGKTFEHYEKLVNKLEEQENYSYAIELTQEVWDRFPDKKFELLKEMEYLNVKTKKFEENLKLWEKGHQKGFFFLLNKRMKQYEPYLQFEQFDTLEQKDTFLRESAIAEARTIYQIVEPINFDRTKTYPLLILLHGGGSNMEDAKQRWKPLPVFEKDYIVAYFQSYRHYDSKTFGWSSSDIRAYEELRNCYEEITNEYYIDTLQVIIGGTSAGGTMAFDLAFNSIIPIQGIISFCPGKPRDLETIDIVNPDLKVFMLGGETDFYLAKQKEMTEIFEKTGIQYIHKIIAGMGNDFPESYAEEMIEAFEFLRE